MLQQMALFCPFLWLSSIPLYLRGQTGSVGTSVASAEQDELSQRLARLRDQVWPLDRSEASRPQATIRRRILYTRTSESARMLNCSYSRCFSLRVYSALQTHEEFPGLLLTLNWIWKFCVACDQVYLVNLTSMNLSQKFSQNSSSRVFSFLLELSKLTVFFLLLCSW